MPTERVTPRSKRCFSVSDLRSSSFIKERSCDVLDTESATARLTHRDDIEAAVAGCRRMLLQPPLRAGDHPLFLAVRDRLERIDSTSRPARPHLHKHHQRTETRHDVEFAAAISDVARQESIAVRSKPAGRHRFGELSTTMARVHAATIGSPQSAVARVPRPPSRIGNYPATRYPPAAGGRREVFRRHLLEVEFEGDFEEASESAGRRRRVPEDGACPVELLRSLDP